MDTERKNKIEKHKHEWSVWPSDYIGIYRCDICAETYTGIINDLEDRLNKLETTIDKMLKEKVR
jgi:hypothetical protein